MLARVFWKMLIFWALPCEEIGSSDPDLSDSDWTESDFQVIFGRLWKGFGKAVGGLS